MGYHLTSQPSIFSRGGINFTPRRLELPVPGLSSSRSGYPKLPGGCPELGLITSPDPDEGGCASPHGEAVVSPGFARHFVALWRTIEEEENREHLAPSSSTVSTPETPPFLVEVVDRIVLDGEPLDQNLRVAACLAAMDPHASKHWKSLLGCEKKSRVNNSLRAILSVVFRLAIDEVGHHLVRKLISACDEKNLHVVVTEVAAHQKQLLETAKNALGVKWVQHLLQLAKPWKTLICILSFALFGGAADLMMDKYGSRLIKECLSRLCCQQNRFIYVAALDNLTTVAKNECGCDTLIKIIDHAPAATKHQLLTEIISHSTCLAQDPYGNYVVQHIFDLGEEKYEERLCWEVRSHLLQLCTQKNGSHVVEKCLASAGGRLLLEDLVSHKKLLQIAQDSYGNYVVNAALRLSKTAAPLLHQRLVEALRVHSRSLRHHPHRRHVYKNVAEGADYRSTSK
ncbi:unnamed protein product [Spirodela intermedia]|uniref:PUM-HD domain-containing protein n=1 Tax=Spirodela intermedia TaxID=51605 RepID=A0A7I8K888_SPIIN|nr:unnamed protein product [Spirodela intermedia]